MKVGDAVEVEGKTYYATKAKRRSCDGCVFDLVTTARCPEKSDGSVLCATTLVTGEAPIFLAEDEFLKRRLKGEI